MPRGDRTGPPKGSKGPRSGKGGGRGRAPGPGVGPMTGGKRLAKKKKPLTEETKK